MGSAMTSGDDEIDVAAFVAAALSASQDVTPPGHPFGDDVDIIDAFTRADLMVLGELVDVTAMAVEAGVRVPVALTRAVWEDCVAWTAADNARKGTLQDEQGRLWDVLFLLAARLRRAAGTSALEPLHYEVLRVPRSGTGLQPRRVQLKVLAGGGDAGEPALTALQPQAD